MRTNSALTLDQIHKAAPSVFATQPYFKMSDRYQFIPTVQVLDHLQREGFAVVSARESRTTIQDKRGYVKHELRLRQANQIGNTARQVGDVFPEIILTNSHDGSSTYQMDGGLYRLVCANGMCLPEAGYESVRTKHYGDIEGEVIDGCITVLDAATEFAERAQQWRTIHLAQPEQKLLAHHAGMMRWGQDEATHTSLAPVTAEQLLRPRRWDDNKDDLWTTFNRIQENLTKGGLRGISSNGRRRKTREITGIDADMRLNKQLSALAAEFAKLKGC
jgi:hypothetical protein